MTESRHFFFTEVDRLMPQTQTSPAFGPIDHTKFRTTHNFKIKTETNSEGAKAYAPFDGKVILIDYNPAGGLVNLILVPRGAGLIKGFTPGIRCVIFRGINRLDYFPNGDNVIITKSLANNKPVGSVFKRWATLNVTSELSEGADLITKKNLDWHNETSDDAELITEVIRLSPSIAWFKKGEVLGSFKSASDEESCGIDVMLDEYKWLFTLAITKGRSHVIEVADATADILSDNALNRSKKEGVNNFMDPILLYTLPQANVQYVNNGVLEDGTPEKVYDFVIPNFINRNKFYLDLRNNNDYSLDFYGSGQTQNIRSFNLKVGGENTPNV